MCVTSEPAKLEGTLIGLWDINHPKYGYQHVLAYQNIPESLSDKPNCMLLHIPSEGPLLPQNILDTSGENKDVLKDIIKALTPLSRGGDRGVAVAAGGNYVHEMGIYHIAILNDLGAVQETLLQIPIEKRPSIPPNFVGFYAKNYPNYPLLLCCFNNRDSAETSPIMVYYTPQKPNEFRLPNIEGHGELPELGSFFDGQRTFMFGSGIAMLQDAIPVKGVNEKVSAGLVPFLPMSGFIKKKRGLINLDFMAQKVAPNQIVCTNWDIDKDSIGKGAFRDSGPYRVNPLGFDDVDEGDF
ncbi:MAG: hypothetical protein GY810_23195 [Aureispira sp.]|nr:hypothetical protein [Aureispira sp.]